MRLRFSRGDEAYLFFALVLTKHMDDQEQNVDICPADCSPTLLAILDLILLKERERIEENSSGVLKRDAVLNEIRNGLVLVPFKPLAHKRMLLHFCLSPGILKYEWRGIGSLQ